MGYTPPPDKRRGDELQTDIRWKINRALEILELKALAEPDPIKRTRAIGEAMHQLRLANNSSHELDRLYREWQKRGPYNGGDDD